MPDTKPQEVELSISTNYPKCWITGDIDDVRVTLTCKVDPDEIAKTMRLVEKITQHAWLASLGQL